MLAILPMMVGGVAVPGYASVLRDRPNEMIGLAFALSASSSMFSENSLKSRPDWLSVIVPVKVAPFYATKVVTIMRPYL